MRCYLIQCCEPRIQTIITNQFPILVRVKRILRKHGYPPDLQDATIQTMLRQAEALSAQWAT